MNLISILFTATIGLIILSALGQGMVGMSKAQSQIAYRQDMATARFVIESGLNCQKTKPNGSTCSAGTTDILSKNNAVVAPTASGWQVGKALVTATCDGNGISVYSKQVGTSNAPTLLIPIKLCGNI